MSDSTLDILAEDLSKIFGCSKDKAVKALREDVIDVKVTPKQAADRWSFGTAPATLVSRVEHYIIAERQTLGTNSPSTAIEKERDEWKRRAEAAEAELARRDVVKAVKNRAINDEHWVAVREAVNKSIPGDLYDHMWVAEDPLGCAVLIVRIKDDKK